MANFIDSFEITNKFLSLYCICPFHLDKQCHKLRSRPCHIIYHILCLLLYEVILLFSAYFKFMHGVFIQTNLSQGSILITWVMLARSFTIGVILSLCNRNNQIHLFYKIVKFDKSIRSKLNQSMPYVQPMQSFVALIYVAVIYNYSIYVILAFYYSDNLATVVFYMCCTHADVYFSIYLLYIAYWGKIYADRFDVINDAFRVLLRRPRILHNALENMLELYNDLFDIYRWIGKTFGSIMFYTIFYHSLTIAVATYALINSCVIHVSNLVEDLVVSLLWMIPICLRVWYLVHTYESFGMKVGGDGGW